jgi:CBS domain containing-hemolysin-like protein
VETNSDTVLLIGYVLLALGVSFLCSIAEAVLLSITPSYIGALKEKRPRRAASLKRLKQDNVDRSLAAILTLNTIAHTLGAIGAGAKATIVFGSAWFGLFSVIMTLMILFLSEIVPKTIGAVYWSRLVGPTALFVRFLIFILLPVVWISEVLTRLISRGRHVHVVSREELMAMAGIGVATGQIHLDESRIIHNLLKFKFLRVTDIMTPRTVISALPQDMTIRESVAQVSKMPFSRIPIYDVHIDRITGFVIKDDVLVLSTQRRQEEKLEDIKRELPVVPESIALPVLLEQFLKNRQHIAIVVNEHGGTDGLVTLEDLIETLMGMEIVDETDSTEDMRALARKRWLKRAKTIGMDLEALEDRSRKEEKGVTSTFDI